MEVLVTGATGLLGQKFMRQLCRRKETTKAYILIRNTQKATELFTKKIDPTFEKIEFLQGNIQEKNFGLTKKDLQKLTKTKQFYHLAAIVHLGQGEKTKKKLEETNIQGTKNALEILQQLPNIQRFTFVSTAYAAGEYNKKIPETFLQKPKTYRNEYEKSKWKCEEKIKEYTKKHKKLQYTIIRPSILLDYLDNKAVDNHTIYLLSKLIFYHSKFVGKNLTLQGNPETELNFVFVDDLVEFILLTNKDKKSQIYNFVAEKNISINKLATLFKNYLNFKKEILFTNNGIKNTHNKTENTFQEKTKAFIPYMKKGTMEWKRNNTQKLLEKHKKTISGEAETLLNLEAYCKNLQRKYPLKLRILAPIIKTKEKIKAAIKG